LELDLEQAISVLERTPATLQSLLKGLPDPWISNNEGPDSWSPFDIVGHLIHGEKTDWVPRIKIILEYGPVKTFEPFDRFAMFQDSRGKSLDDLLYEFEQLRLQNLNVLRELNLQPRDFSQRGMHPDLGPVTLKQLLATWVVHDLSHLAQIAEVMARQYREQIGPWKTYFPVLHTNG